MTDQPIKKCINDIVETTVEDEAVVMRLQDGKFFSLDGTGYAIWGLIDGARTADEIAQEMCERYDGDAAVVDGNVRSFLDELREFGLISQA